MRSIFNITLALFVLAIIATCVPAFAEPDAWEKLERGAINTTTGWMELGNQPRLEIEHGDQPVADAFLGFGKGILAGLQRTGYGLSDALSFPLGPHDRPVMEPETLFEGK